MLTRPTSRPVPGLLLSRGGGGGRDGVMFDPLIYLRITQYPGSRIRLLSRTSYSVSIFLRPRSRVICRDPWHPG